MLCCFKLKKRSLGGLISLITLLQVVLAKISTYKHTVTRKTINMISCKRSLGSGPCLGDPRPTQPGSQESSIELKQVVHNRRRTLHSAMIRVAGPAGTCGKYVFIVGKSQEASTPTSTCSASKKRPQRRQTNPRQERFKTRGWFGMRLSTAGTQAFGGWLKNGGHHWFFAALMSGCGTTATPMGIWPCCRNAT